jgi:hypothetical protein
MVGPWPLAVVTEAEKTVAVSEESFSLRCCCRRTPPHPYVVLMRHSLTLTYLPDMHLPKSDTKRKWTIVPRITRKKQRLTFYRNPASRSIHVHVDNE